MLRASRRRCPDRNNDDRHPAKFLARALCVDSVLWAIDPHPLEMGKFCQFRLSWEGLIHDFASGTSGVNGNSCV